MGEDIVLVVGNASPVLVLSQIIGVGKTESSEDGGVEFVDDIDEVDEGSIVLLDNDVAFVTRGSYFHLSDWFMELESADEARFELYFSFGLGSGRVEHFGDLEEEEASSAI